jgi:hypothetical protein
MLGETMNTADINYAVSKLSDNMILAYALDGKLEKVKLQLNDKSLSRIVAILKKFRGEEYANKCAEKTAKKAASLEPRLHQIEISDYRNCPPGYLLQPVAFELVHKPIKEKREIVTMVEKVAKKDANKRESRQAIRTRFMRVMINREQSADLLESPEIEVDKIIARITRYIRPRNLRLESDKMSNFVR